MSLNGFSYTTCDFATKQKKRKRNTKYHKNLQNKHWIVNITDNLVPKGDKKQKSRIGLLHRNRFAEGIQLTWTIISKIYRKKKDLPKSANDTIIYRLSLWYKQWKVEVAYSTMQHDSTLNAPKLLNDIQHSHPISQSCLLKGKKHKMLQSKSQ